MRHPDCLGTYDDYTGEYDCEYKTTLTCDECKFGVGRKNPAAKCNCQHKYDTFNRCVYCGKEK